MTHPVTVRRSLVGAVAGALLGASALAAVPGGAVHQAVVSFSGSAPAVDGVEVVQTLPTLHQAVVRGTSAALGRLSSVPGVRGMSPDDAIQLTSRSDEDDDSRSFLASTGLHGAAGKDGAGAGVRVAVIDTGVSDTAALERSSGRLVDAVDTSKAGITRTSGDFTDGYGHGTFMASVIAGGEVAGTDGKNLGIAPGATVLVVKVAQEDGTTSLSRVLAGLDWVASHPQRVDVANLSFSHKRPQKAYGADPLTDAVEAVRDAGVTVVVSSGNTRGTVGDPGFDPRVLTVGAADLRTGRVASFSGSDDVLGVSKPDVVANGVRVLGLLPAASVLAQLPGTRHLAHGLFRGSGTSQATAVTSGLAALFLAAHPSATPTQVKASLRCASRDLRGHRDGAGLVRTTTDVCSGTDGQALDGSGDATGESDFDANAWGANAWAANSWGANSWGANSWGANSWGANSWGANSWGSDD